MKTYSRSAYMYRHDHLSCFYAFKQHWCTPWRLSSHLEFFSLYNTLLMQQRELGNFSMSTFHYCNPEHGVAYSPIDRRMRDDEVEDFMKSVKGWKYLYLEEEEEKEKEKEKLELRRDRKESQEFVDINNKVTICQNVENATTDGIQGNGDKTSSNSECTNIKLKVREGICNGNNSCDDADTAECTNTHYVNDEPGPPPASEHFLAHDAIKRTFTFDTFNEAYLYFGRLYAFCYFEDKYPPVEWRHNKITIYLYSPKYKGLTRREARIAAFANDQYNMFRKSKKQQAKLQEALLGVTNNKELQKENIDMKNINSNSSDAFDKKNHGAKTQAMSKLRIAEIFNSYAPASLQQELELRNTAVPSRHSKMEDLGEVFDFKSEQKKKER